MNRHFGLTSKVGKHTLGDLVGYYISKVLPEKKDKTKQTMQLNWSKSQLGTHRLQDISLPLISDGNKVILRDDKV